MPSKTLALKSHLPRAYAELLLQVGNFMEHWGFKQVHGQVWACVFLSEHPVDARHIIEHLKVSKAAVSLAIKDLIDYEVIEELEKTKPSTRKYVSNPDLCEVILNVLRGREKPMLASVVDTAQAFLALGSAELQRVHVSSERVKELKAMATSAHEILECLIKSREGSLEPLMTALTAEPH